MFKGSSRMYFTHLNIAHYVHKARLQNSFHFSLHNTTRRSPILKSRKLRCKSQETGQRVQTLYVLNLAPEPMFLYPQRGGLMMFMKHKTFKSSLDVKIK